jgi:hypothetical protein
MLFPDPLDHHRRLAQCAWVGAMPHVAFGFGVLWAGNVKMSRRGTWMAAAQQEAQHPFAARDGASVGYGRPVWCITGSSASPCLLADSRSGFA